MTKLCRGIALFWLLLLLPLSAWSIPTQFGDTGLLSQPTADTLDSGNICVGLWANVSDGEAASATVLPFSLTLGLGSFLEFYGSYPNLLFNDKETASGRGYVNLGSKIRLLGKRSSLIKVALDGQLQRKISIDPDLDGLVDYQGRMIATVANERFGIHAYGAYRKNEDPIGIVYEDQVGFGGGIEFFPTDRLRLIVEAESFAEKISGTDRSAEITGGFHYFISPHLTFSLGVGYGLTDQSPDLRLLAGFSTCQGIGSYSLNKLEEEVKNQDLSEDLKSEPVKVLKLKMLTPLIQVPSSVDTSTVPGVGATPVLKLPTPTPVPVVVPVPVVTSSIPIISPLPAVAAPTVAAPTTAAPTTAAPTTAAPTVAAPTVAALAAVATELEVVVSPDAPFVMIDPSDNIISPGTVPAPSVNFPDSPAQASTASAVTPVLSELTMTKPYRKFVLPEFTFQFGKYNLAEDGKAVLAGIAKELAKDEKWFIIRLDGHTDSTGPAQYNDKLSLQRAIDYAMYLINEENIDSRRIFVKGFGENAPISSNATPEGRRLNRRVELLLLVRAQKEL